MRHSAPITEYDPKRGISIATLAYEYVSRFQVPEHAHGSDQLIYAVRGVMEVSSGRNVWFIPPQFALWIPALTYHRIHMPEAVSMRTLYLRTSLAARAETDCAVLHVNTLLRELILEIVKVGELRVRDGYHCGLSDVLMRQLHEASTMPTMMTLPREERALAVARAILRHPAESRSMRLLCSEAGVGVRTMERIFLKEVGTSFEAWRRQVRLKKQSSR